MYKKNDLPNFKEFSFFFIKSSSLLDGVSCHAIFLFLFDNGKSTPEFWQHSEKLKQFTNSHNTP